MKSSLFSRKFPAVCKDICIAAAICISLSVAAVAQVANLDPLTAADTQFLIAAARAGATEISASQDAIHKAPSSQVQNFANQMLTDHTRINEELKQLASIKNITLSDQPDGIQGATIRKLSTLEGKDYEKQYASDIGVTAHREAVNLFKNASNSADPDVKAFALKTLPSLEHHLRMAEELQNKIAQ
ncbi:DUF4142 domain-containing protein [Undibacterium sp. TC9W]|uniref:DUF4142 domain-containing protein n=1 Tax=Undibacterium sp. TC9W TaxID=3413053 RepID=UPI003BEFD09E